MIRHYPRLILAAGLTAIACYLAANDQPALIAGVWPVAVAAWMLRGSRVASHIPRLTVNLAVLAAMAYAGAVVVSRGLEVEGVAVLVIVLLILKFFDRTSARDYAQILGLSTFLVIAAVLTSARFEMALLLAAFIPMVGTAAMLHQVYAGHEATTAAARRAAPVGAAARSPLYAGERAAAHFLRLGSASAAVITVLAAVTFVLIPRGIGLDMMGRWSKVAAGSQTRFTPDVQLGKAGFISTSPRIVLYLQVFDRSGVSLGGPSAVYHLRGEVLDHYNPQSGMWSRSADKKQYDKSSRGGQGWAAGEPVKLGEQVNEATVEQRVTLLNASGSSAFVFTLQRPVTVTFDRDVNVRWNAADRRMLLENETGQVQYRIQSILVDTPNATGRGPRLESDPSGAEAVTEPAAHSAAVQSLATEIVERAGVDLALINREHAANAGAARALERYLRENYTYTTEIEAPPADAGRGADPVEWFLLEHRRGHCEYFASAMAVMCQSLGIPARVIAGYVAAEWSQAGGHYIVRESNAHAWVEVEQSRNVWRTFDPTPPTDLDRLHRPSPGVLARARRLFDAVEHAWISSIVTFDQGARRRLADRADPGGFDLVRRVQRVSARARSGGLSLALRAGAAGVGAALAAWLAMSVLRAAWRGLRRAGAPPPAAERGEGVQTRFYTDLLRALELADMPKPPWLPPLEHGELIRGERPEAGQATERLARLYYEVRFGSRPLTDSQRGEIEPALRAVRAGGTPSRGSPA